LVAITRAKTNSITHILVAITLVIAVVGFGGAGMRGGTDRSQPFITGVYLIECFHVMCSMKDNTYHIFFRMLSLTNGFSIISSVNFINFPKQAINIFKSEYIKTIVKIRSRFLYKVLKTEQFCLN
jgi:hypothetical protein